MAAQYEVGRMLRGFYRDCEIGVSVVVGGAVMLGNLWWRIGKFFMRLRGWWEEIDYFSE